MAGRWEKHVGQLTTCQPSSPPGLISTSYFAPSNLPWSFCSCHCAAGSVKQESWRGVRWPQLNGLDIWFPLGTRSAVGCGAWRSPTGGSRTVRTGCRKSGKSQNNITGREKQGFPALANLASHGALLGAREPQGMLLPHHAKGRLHLYQLASTAPWIGVSSSYPWKETSETGLLILVPCSFCSALHSVSC